MTSFSPHPKPRSLRGFALEPPRLLPYPAGVALNSTPANPDLAAGGPQSAEDLLPLVYTELRCLAAARLAGLPPHQTLQPTALVHEAWLRLAGDAHPPAWGGRGHFFAAAAEAMRRILVERARGKAAAKRGRNPTRVDLDQVDLAHETNADLLLLLDEALTELAVRQPEAAGLIKLRFFAGMPNAEAAELLGVPERTAKRHWAYARAWLYEAIQKKL